ncbi:hypothetical protein [Methylocystis sp. SB2]|uniref:hypothetical protein n=1 Tax=Methylocystis sp. (strain SB2) TaxID=743836 RepID=UPI00042128A7|nr:hypothetical protein [Methylocystis sp. SB2]ULO25123.1 hypothetical protein LNB28_06965 [Methylocystis sp. SB2]
MQEEPLYVDASQAAQLEHGAITENYLTLQEAKIVYDKLPQERQEIAKITSAGRVYSASEIERFHYGARTTNSRPASSPP